MEQPGFSRGLLVLFFAFLFWQSASLQPVRKGLPQITDKYAVRGATVIQSPGDTLRDALILIDDGMIHYVGKDKEVDGAIYAVKADSMFVYAGFIDAFSHTGLKKQEQGNERERIDDPGNPTNEQAGIQPGRSVLDMVDPGSRAISDLRQLGFTISHVFPEGRMLPGQGSLLLLAGDQTDHMLFRQDISVYARFQGVRRAYPGTVIGVMAKFREIFRNAENALAHRRIFAEEEGIERPAYDRSLLAFLPVVSNEKPVYFEAPDLKSVHRALALQKELGFQLVLANVKQAWSADSKITDANARVVLSLDIPDEKEEKKQEKEVSEEETPEPGWSKNELDALKKKRSESLAKYLEEPARLARAGMQFSFSTDGVKAKEIMTNLRKMVKNGLDEGEVLAALTTHPAQLLGISKWAGTVETGKMANLVILDAPFLEEDAQVRYVFVDGDLYAYEAKKKKSASKKGDVARVNGAWTYTVDVPGDTRAGVFTINGEPGKFTGVIATGNSEETDLENIEYADGTLNFEFSTEVEGTDVRIKVALEFDGDAYTGRMNVGPFGSFPMEGSRKSPENKL